MSIQCMNFQRHPVTHLILHLNLNQFYIILSFVLSQEPPNQYDKSQVSFLSFKTFWVSKFYLFLFDQETYFYTFISQVTKANVWREKNNSFTFTLCIRNWEIAIWRKGEKKEAKTQSENILTLTLFSFQVLSSRTVHVTPCKNELGTSSLLLQSWTADKISHYILSNGQLTLLSMFSQWPTPMDITNCQTNFLLFTIFSRYLTFGLPYILVFIKFLKFLPEHQRKYSLVLSCRNILFYIPFLPSSSRLDTAIWMHYIDAN